MIRSAIPPHLILIQSVILPHAVAKYFIHDLPVVNRLAMEQLRSWSATPERLCFHLLAGQRALKVLATRPRSEWLWLAGWSLRYVPTLTIVDASDNTLTRKLNALGLEYLRSKAWPVDSKTSMFTVTKLFAHRLLSLNRTMILDDDIYAMADVCELWDEFELQTILQPELLLGYASEQQNEYSLLSMLSFMPGLPPLGTQGYNGGVAILALDRMRTHGAFEASLAIAHKVAQEIHEECKTTSSASYCEHISCSLLLLGDQTILTLASLLSPGWSNLMWRMPCEWNWQTSIAYYAPANHDNRRYVRGICREKMEQMMRRDSTCAQPPKLLHFNYPQPLKKAHQLEFRMFRGEPNARRHNIEALSSAFRDVEVQQTCRMSEQFVNISHRACNASFLLSRLRE